MKLTRTSDPASTSRGNALRPFWNRSTSEMSKRLLSPTGIGSVGTDLNSSSPSAGSTVRRSWCTTLQKTRTANKNSLTISWQSATSSSRETTGEGQGPGSQEPTKLKSVRSRKIKLNPSREWRVVLNRWMGTSRWVYNRCLDLVKKKKCRVNRGDFRDKVVCGHNHGEVKKRTGKKRRKRGKNRGNWTPGRKHSKIPMKRGTSWVLDTPFEIRDSGMVDLCKAFESNWGKRKINPDHTFDVGFRSKRGVQTIKIPGRCIKNGEMFKRFSCKGKLEGFEDWTRYDGEVIIQKDRCGDFWAVVLEQRDVMPPEVKNPRDLKVAALDPGVRTFNTCVDSEGNVLEFSPGDISRIYRLCHHMDNLQSRAFDKSLTSKKRYRLRKAWHRSISRIRNLVTDVRRKSVKLLCEKYDVIFLPEFNTKDMCNRAKRRVNGKTARGMMTWSHYKFRELLKTTALREGTKLVSVTEEYTSKTCSCCGVINKNLGSSKVFRCSSSSCGMVCDRDENGARNILLKSCMEKELSIRWMEEEEENGEEEKEKETRLGGEGETLGPTPGSP